MNPDIFQPIVRESLERLKADGFTRKQMMSHFADLSLKASRLVICSDDDF